MVEPQPPALSRADITGIISGLLLAMLLGALDQTIVATAMPTIGRDLGDPEHLPWIVTAYLLAATAATPLYGKLADIHGRRVMLLWSIGLFVAGSIACGLSRNMLVLAAARALQGFGGGGLISLSQTIIADLVSPRERLRYQAAIASVFVTSSVAGPVLGGFFAEHLHWTTIFWINLPLGLVAFLMTNGRLKRAPRYERPHRLDLPGALLLTGATTSLLLALSWGGRVYPWASPAMLALVGASLALWVAFGARLASADEPLFPLNVLRDRVVRASTLGGALAMGVFIGLSIYMPIYLEGVRGLTASQSGLALIPLMLGTVAGATISARLMLRIRRYRVLPLAGLVAALAALIVFAFGAAPDFLTMEILFFVISIGLGAVLPVATITVQNAVDLHEMGTATALANGARQLGGALVVAVFGALVIGAFGGAAGAGEGFDIAHADRASLTAAFHNVFVAAICIVAAAALCMALLEDRPMRERERTTGAG
jgi:EmrB/QacA subfamily drug resistance transporter